MGQIIDRRIIITWSCKPDPSSLRDLCFALHATLYLTIKTIHLSKVREALLYLNVHVMFQLAQRPTPIHTWNLPGVPDGYHVSIKRDDMTGSTLSGNKVVIS